MFVLLRGTLLIGYIAYGPFLTRDKAQEVADTFGNFNYVITYLQDVPLMTMERKAFR